MDDTPQDWRDQALSRAIAIEGAAKYGVPDDEFVAVVPRLTKQQAAIIGAYTGINAGPFGDVHEYVEKVLGRPVLTHEFQLRAVQKQIEDAARADFLALCHDPTVADGVAST